MLISAHRASLAPTPVWFGRQSTDPPTIQFSLLGVGCVEFYAVASTSSSHRALSVVLPVRAGRARCHFLGCTTYVALLLCICDLRHRSWIRVTWEASTSWVSGSSVFEPPCPFVLLSSRTPHSPVTSFRQSGTKNVIAVFSFLSCCTCKKCFVRR